MSGVSVSLEPGRTLAHYRIASRLGAGGMGEVFRARDTRLDRDVALKLLPSTFTSDAERLARFEREAKLLAALNHPHIAAIYGLEELDGQRVLVMELAEGEDPSFPAGRPHVLFEGNYLDGPGLANYDVTADGQRFLMVRGRTGAGGAEVDVVLHWFEELHRAAKSEKKP